MVREVDSTKEARIENERLEVGHESSKLGSRAGGESEKKKRERLEAVTKSECETCR